MNELPSKLSDLILLAVADMKKATRQGHTIDMHHWVRVKDEFCSVCMAGAVMIGTCGVKNSVLSASDAGVTRPDRRKFYALNSIRRGEVLDGLTWMCSPDPVRLTEDQGKMVGTIENRLDRLLPNTVDYPTLLSDDDKARRKFYPLMRWTAAKLAEVGL